MFSGPLSLFRDTIIQNSTFGDLCGWPCLLQRERHIYLNPTLSHKTYQKDWTQRSCRRDVGNCVTGQDARLWRHIQHSDGNGYQYKYTSFLDGVPKISPLFFNSKEYMNVVMERCCLDSNIAKIRSFPALSDPDSSWWKKSHALSLRSAKKLVLETTGVLTHVVGVCFSFLLDLREYRLRNQLRHLLHTYPVCLRPKRFFHKWYAVMGWLVLSVPIKSSPSSVPSSPR